MVSFTVNPKHRAWLPCQGKASSMEETIVQTTIRVIAWLPVYTAIVTTLTLLAVTFGLPFIGND